MKFEHMITAGEAQKIVQAANAFDQKKMDDLIAALDASIRAVSKNGTSRTCFAMEVQYAQALRNLVASQPSFSSVKYELSYVQMARPISYKSADLDKLSPTEQIQVVVSWYEDKTS